MGIRFENKLISKNEFKIMTVKAKSLGIEPKFYSKKKINNFSYELNEKRFYSEVQFQKELTKHQGHRHFRLYKNYPILSSFFIDFACPEMMLAIEIDGSIHRFAEQIKKDEYKTSCVVAAGWNLFRIKFPGFKGIYELNKFIDEWFLKNGDFVQSKTISKRRQRIEEYLIKKEQMRINEVKNHEPKPFVASFKLRKK